MLPFLSVSTKKKKWTLLGLGTNTHITRSLFCFVFWFVRLFFLFLFLFINIHWTYFNSILSISSYWFSLFIYSFSMAKPDSTLDWLVFTINSKDRRSQHLYLQLRESHENIVTTDAIGCHWLIIEINCRQVLSFLLIPWYFCTVKVICYLIPCWMN